MTVAALVLAAGSSKRLGTPKQLLSWGPTTLLGHVLGQVRRLPVDEVWVVLGHLADEIMEEVDFSGMLCVINPEHEEGLASSIRVGMDAISRNSEVDHVLIVMGDQPEIRGDVVESLIRVAKEDSHPAIVPMYRYSRGVPVVLARSLWPRFMSMEGDTGGRKLLQAHPEWVKEVWFEHLPPRDVDGPDDLVDLQPRH